MSRAAGHFRTAIDAKGPVPADFSIGNKNVRVDNLGRMNSPRRYGEQPAGCLSGSGRPPH